MNTPDIHRATEADIDDLLPLIADLAAHNGDTSRATRQSLTEALFSKPDWSHALIARSANAPIGYAILTPVSTIQNGTRAVDIHHLFVVPEMRGQKVGQALISTAKDIAQDWGCALLRISTSAHNINAAQTYLHLGFTEREVTGRFFHLPI